jgi:hypothetical protein
MIAPLFALHHAHQLIAVFESFDEAFEKALVSGWIDWRITLI